MNFLVRAPSESGKIPSGSNRLLNGITKQDYLEALVSHLPLPLQQSLAEREASLPELELAEEYLGGEAEESMDQSQEQLLRKQQKGKQKSVKFNANSASSPKIGSHLLPLSESAQRKEGLSQKPVHLGEQFESVRVKPDFSDEEESPEAMMS